MVRRTSTKEKPQPATPPGMEKVRVTKEFLQPIEPRNGQAIDVEAVEVDAAQEPPPDKYETFFQRVRQEQGWRIVVYRLNSFHKDGRTDMRADKTYVGNIVFDPDTYLDDIQRMWPEGGTFKIQSKDPDNDWNEQWTETIAPVRNPTAAGNPNSTHYFIQQPAQQPAAPVEQRDTLQELIDAGEKAAKLKKVFGWDHEPTVVQATPVAATVEREPLQDRLVGGLIDLVIKSEKPETATQMLANYLNPPKDDSWADIIKELLKPLIPMAGGIVAAILQQQAARAQQAQQQAAARQNGQPQQLPQPQGQPGGLQGPAMTWQEPQPSPMQPGFAAPTQPFVMPAFEMGQPAEQVHQQPEPIEEPMTPEEEEEMGRDDLIYNLAEMLEQCVRKAAADPAVIEKGCAEVIAYKQRFPLMTGLIDALTTMPPEAIIGLLAAKVPEVFVMINNEVAKQTIVDFQKALKREDGDNG